MPIDLRIYENFFDAVARYKHFDLLMVNSLFDGMNLVAKEAPAVNTRNGVLMLSENTGSHEELADCALSVNPFDIQEQADTIYRALTMSDEERRIRAQRLKEIIYERNPGDWVDEQLADIEELRRDRARGPSRRAPGPGPPRRRHVSRARTPASRRRGAGARAAYRRRAGACREERSGAGGGAVRAASAAERAPARVHGGVGCGAVAGRGRADRGRLAARAVPHPAECAPDVSGAPPSAHSPSSAGGSRGAGLSAGGDRRRPAAAAARGRRAGPAPRSRRGRRSARRLPPGPRRAPRRRRFRILRKGLGSRISPLAARPREGRRRHRHRYSQPPLWTLHRANTSWS